MRSFGFFRVSTTGVGAAVHTTGGNGQQSIRRGLAVLSALAVGSVAVSAFAQQHPGTRPGAVPARPRPPNAAPTAPTAVAAAGSSPTLAVPANGQPAAPGSDSFDAAGVSKVGDLMAPVQGGITADQVGQRAMQTSYAAKASEQAIAGASARSQAAWTNFLPRIGFTGRYTRLSNFVPPSLTGGASGSFVATNEPSGTTNPGATYALGFDTLTFPLVLDNWLAQATIAVPISDYFFRIGQGYSAATHSEEAARFDLIGARAKSYADGKIAYYTWLRARGAVVVAAQTLAVARAHLKDAQNQFTVGNASKADVLRAETTVASSELFLERAKSNVVQTERQVRVAIHAKDEEMLAPSDTIDGAMSPVTGNIKQLVAEGMSKRPEIKSIDKNADAARKQASVQNAGKYPVVSGFGDVTYANPNSRRFPQSNEWFPTWSLGAQVTWSPNDMLIASPQAADAEARANQLEAQKGTMRDGIEIEIVQAYQGVVEADTAIETTERQLASAVESYRVARELFNNGRGTGTTVIDAEQALAQTRLDHLNARVDARVARVRLDHALGRDVR
ncbi:MAG: TolC family protein [Polyangiaceae bacterium]|nr:TolC family protein [Polyangiaceae bacterium]